VLNTVINIGKVDSQQQEEFILVGYDDILSVQYFGENLRPWWKDDAHPTIEKQLSQAATDYQAVMKSCADFNTTLYKDLVSAGGAKYADLCVLAYRQSIAAHKLVRSSPG
jgi:hypothetical protein